MPLDTAIRALNPVYYWHFGDAAGSTTAHDEIGVTNLTVTGTDPFHVVGPEVGSFGARLWSDTIMLGPNWGVGAWASFSLMLMATVPANGSPPAPVDFMGIGDPANRHVRGMYFQHYSTAPDSAATRISGSLNSLPAAIAQPTQTWHLWTWISQLSPQLQGFYDNGTLVASQTFNPGVAPLATDRLWLQSANPIVVAHLAWFPRVLNQAEVQTVSNQVLPWPYQQPINLPSTWLAGGFDPTIQPVIIAPTDTVTQDLKAQLQAHDDKLQAQLPAIAQIPALLPAVKTVTDQIPAWLTRAFQTVGGLVLQTPIGGLISHPDPNILSLSPEPFVISGRGALSGIPPFNFAGIYGIAWAATGVPLSAGLRDGAVQEYSLRLVQFGVQYFDHNVSNLYVGELVDFHQDNYLWQWTRYNPHQLLYDVTPGFELTCWWFGAF